MSNHRRFIFCSDIHGAKYRAIRNEEERKEQNRQAQDRYRQRNPQRKSKPLPGELEYIAAVQSGATPEQLAEIEAKHLPRVCQ